jgi:outer membrane receptor for ferrienterochelin and colicins
MLSAAYRHAAVPLAFALLLGHVTDRTTGQALPGIAVSAGGAHAKTDAAGNFRLVGVKPGRLTVTLSSDDVPPQDFPVTVGKTKTKSDFSVCSITLDYHC